MELAHRTIQSAGQDIVVRVIATGNGPALQVENCPLIPLSMADTHRLLSRFARATDGEGLTEVGERLSAVLGELA